MNSIGLRLREERKRLDLTQQALADVVGVSKLTLGKYENDKRTPDADFLAKLSDAGVDILYVVSGSRAQAITLYQRAQDALMPVLDVQEELGLLFSGEQIKEILAQAYRWQLDKKALRELVINSFKIANQPLPKREEKDSE